MTDNKTDSLLDMISQAHHFYYYFRGGWANGKEGAISDFKGNGIYRFFPSKKDAKGNLMDEEVDHDDYVTNPIVATGIVGYWLHFRKNRDRLASLFGPKEEERKNILELFVSYTEDKLKQYIEREQEKPSSWRRNLEKEFYTDFIIHNEEILNEKTEELMPFITPSDRELVKELMSEYLLYLEDKKKAYGKVREDDKGDNTFKPIGQTFTKTTKVTDLQLTLLMQRLSMSNKLDPDVSADEWLKLFSGVNSMFTMKWLGTPGELRDFFDLLTRPLPSSKTGYVIPHYGYQKIVRSHFTNVNGEYFKNLKAQKKISSYQPILDDCAFFLQCVTERMTGIMKTIIQQHKEELSEQGLFYNATASKWNDRTKIQNKL